MTLLAETIFLLLKCHRALVIVLGYSFVFTDPKYFPRIGYILRTMAICYFKVLTCSFKITVLSS